MYIVQRQGDIHLSLFGHKSVHGTQDSHGMSTDTEPEYQITLTRGILEMEH